jgi:glycosyltransferase involved in cell wall biosynthesis
VRAAIISPNPADNSGGVERFCHTLSEVITGLGGEATVVTAVDADKIPHDLVISNGMVSRRTEAPRIHVYHGCWVDHVRLGTRTAGYSPQWRAQFLVKGAAKEVRAGWGAYRVAVSEPTAGEVERWYRRRVNRVIPNGIDTSLFAIGDQDVARKQLGVAADERIALFVGRAEPRKRPDLAAEAARRAGFRLLAAGSGSVPGATGLGVLTPSALNAWIQAADCVLLPSEYEACSIAILEALATGTAVVTTRVGYVRTLIEQVPAYRGLTADAGDVDGLAAALSSLEGSEAAVQAATAFIRSENGLDRFAAHWAEAIDDTLTGRPGPRTAV